MIYLIVAKSENTYWQRFDPTALKNLLYACHVLGLINGFEVVSGYTDFLGLLLRAGGVIFHAINRANNRATILATAGELGQRCMFAWQPSGSLCCASPAPLGCTGLGKAMPTQEGLGMAPATRPARGPDATSVGDPSFEV